MSSDFFGTSTDTPDMEKANDKALEDLNDALKGDMYPEEIPVDQPDDDEDDDDDDEDEGEKKSRKQKRKERGELFSALQQEREEKERLSREVSELRNNFSQFQQQSQNLFRQQQGDPIQEQIAQTWKEERELRAHATALHNSEQLTDDTRKELDAKYEQLAQRRQELTTQKVMRDHNIRPVNPNEGVIASLRAKYSDVYANPQAEQYAKGRWQQLRAMGNQDSLELVDTVMNETREAFKLKQPSTSAPSSAMKSKYHGVPSGGLKSGGDRSSSRKIPMTREMKMIAEEHYSHLNKLSAEEKHRKWAKEIGPEWLKASKG